MIVFLNFTPIEFMGGAERWMSEVSSQTNKKEEALLLDVSSKLANIYGKLVLKRKFNNNLSKPIDVKRLSISFQSLIPFTKKWKNIRSQLLSSRVIYARYELPEIFICLYFGGIGVLKKTIAGLHLSIIYESPISFMHHLHNVIYGSRFYIYLLNKAKLVHVINDRDEEFLVKKFGLTNVRKIYNGTDIPENFENFSRSKDTLNIIFVGELSKRKGVDTLVQVIVNSPSYFKFTIIGDGPMREYVQAICSRQSNSVYLGFVTVSELNTSYDNSDVLLFPSRAEAFGLVMIEAMARGLVIVNSPEITLTLPDYIERTVWRRDPMEFIKVLEDIYSMKKLNSISRHEIISYCRQYFSKQDIIKQLNQELFQLT